MVKKLVELIGGTVRPGSDEYLAKSTRPIFTLPKEINDNKKNIRITYHFQDTTEEDVVVSTRATWFLSDEEGDGLIWDAGIRPIVDSKGVRLPSPRAVGVFGIVRMFSLPTFSTLI